MFKKKYTYTEEGTYCINTGLCVYYFPSIEETKEVIVNIPVNQVVDKVTISKKKIIRKNDNGEFFWVHPDEARIGAGYLKLRY